MLCLLSYLNSHRIFGIFLSEFFPQTSDSHELKSLTHQGISLEMFYNEPTKKDLLQKSERSMAQPPTLQHHPPKEKKKKKNNDFFGASTK